MANFWSTHLQLFHIPHTLLLSLPRSFPVINSRWIPGNLSTNLHFQSCTSRVEENTQHFLNGKQHNQAKGENSLIRKDKSAIQSSSPASLICFQVINIINAAQENSPITVAEALDRVLEILRTTELYSPQLGTKDEDPHTSDLVGGLMTVSKINKDEITTTSALHHSSVLCWAKISQAMGRGLIIYHHFT